MRTRLLPLCLFLCSCNERSGVAPRVDAASDGTRPAEGDAFEVALPKEGGGDRGADASGDVAPDGRRPIDALEEDVPTDLSTSDAVEEDVPTDLGATEVATVDAAGEAGASCQSVSPLQRGDTVGWMASRCQWDAPEFPNAPAAALSLLDGREAMSFQVRVDITPEAYAHQGYVSMPSLAEVGPLSIQGMDVAGPTVGADQGSYFFDVRWANQVAPREGMKLTFTVTFSFACRMAMSATLTTTSTAELVLCRGAAGGLAWTPLGGPCDCTAAAAPPQDCSRCHGQNGDPMPPPAVDGTTSTESLGVGAHLVHVSGTGLARPVPCTECHVVPTTADGIQHPDPSGKPAGVVFGVVATHDSAAPAWDRATGTCTDVFCHGSTLRGADTRPSRMWTRLDESQRACDSCHGYPPLPRHPQRMDCEACHYMVVSANGVIKNPLLHIDGVLEADVTVSP